MNKDYEKQMREAILNKGDIDPKIVEQMTFNEMIEHLVRYSWGFDEKWIPERLKVTS